MPDTQRIAHYRQMLATINAQREQARDRYVATKGREHEELLRRRCNLAKRAAQYERRIARWGG